MANTDFRASAYSDTFNDAISTLEHQMIPLWERHGLERFAVTAPSLKEFRQQKLPEKVQTWAKKLKGKRIVKRKDSWSVKEIWPDDDQQSRGFPVLAFVREGIAEFQVADYVVQCPQGHFLLFAPGVLRPAGQHPHSEEPRERKQCEVWWFSSMGISNYIAVYSCKSQGQHHFKSDHYYIINEPRVIHLLHFFAEEVRDFQSHSVKAANAILLAFLELLLCEIQSGRYYDRGFADAPAQREGNQSPIVLACQYIEKNLNHSLTIDDVARAVFLTRTNFTRQFRLETGKTFQQFLTEKRLEEAKMWLLQENCSVELVCKFVGLKHTRFHELFKQHVGISPMEFRRQFKNGSKPEM